MAKSVEELAELLGAEVVGQIPEVGGGAFGAARLAKIFAERMEPGRGRRPGRPTISTWKKRHKVPMSRATEKKLVQIAEILRDKKKLRVTAMQVAAQFLEIAVKKYDEAIEAAAKKSK